MSTISITVIYSYTNLIRFCPLFFVLTLASSSFGQTVSLQDYTTRDGLPSSQVYDVIQDEFGYIWFSTDKGLSRYNGYQFENFDVTDGLTDNVVFDFLKGPNGKIWCTTNQGSLFFIEGIDPEFHPYKWNDTLVKYKGGNVIREAYFFKEGDLLVNINTRLGYLRISNNGAVVSVTKETKSLEENLTLNVIKNDKVEPFYFLDRKDFYKVKKQSTFFLTKGSSGLTTSEAISFEEKGISIFIRTKYIRLIGSEINREVKHKGKIISSGKCGDDKFWIGYRYGGVHIYNLRGEKQESYLPNLSVTQLFQDDQGNNWITTLENGVFRIKNPEIKTLNAINGRVNELSVGCQEELYIGMYNGDIWERSKVGHVSQLHYSKNEFPAHIAYDAKARMTYFYGDEIFSKERKLNLFAYIGYMGVFDNYLLYGYNYLSVMDLNKISEPPRVLSFKRILDLEQVGETLYFTNMEGFYKIMNFPSNTKVDTIFDGGRLNDLAIWNDRFVLGGNGSGLIVLNKNYKRQVHIQEKDGLTSNFISRVFVEDDRTLWVTTNQGINRIQFDENGNYSIHSLSTNDGLINNEIMDIAILRDTVWLGTQQGVNYFSIQDFEHIQSKKINTRLQWNSILVNNKPIDNSFSFSYDQNSFDFSYTAFLFQGGHDLTYRYKLMGQMEEWKVSNGLAVNFSALAPGSYTMIVQVKTKNGSWGIDKIEYSFIIDPPFWFTWWFIVGCVIVFIGIIYLFFRIRVLTYNKDMIREFMRYFLQKVRKEEPFIIIKNNGKDVKLFTKSIHFVKTAGNYLEVHSDNKMYLVRSSIAKFSESLPDEIEFLQVHRSYLIRIDRVQEKGKRELIVKEEKIPIGKTFTEKIGLIHL